MSQTLDKQLQIAIDKLNDQQKKAMLAIAQAFVGEENRQEAWRDASYVAEMDRRYEDYKAGNAKLVSLDDVEKKARAIAEKMKSKKAS